MALEPSVLLPWMLGSKGRNATRGHFEVVHVPDVNLDELGIKEVRCGTMPLGNSALLLRVNRAMWDGASSLEGGGHATGTYTKLHSAVSASSAMSLGAYLGHMDAEHGVVRYLLFEGSVTERAAAASKLSGSWRILRLLADPVFTFFVFCLVVLYYVVSAIQSWATEYLSTVLHGEFETIIATFGTTAITAPTLGVLLCSYVVDHKLGGYQSHPVNTTLFAILMGTCACMAAVGAVSTANFWVCIAMTWLLLFFGGAIVPAVTGLFQEPAERFGREYSNAVAQLLVSIFGYMGGPIATGYIMQKTSTMRGMHIAYLTSILALVSLLGGLAALKAKQLAQQGDHQLDQEAKTARRQRQAWEAEQEAHGEAELTPRALHDSSSDLD